MVATAGLTGSTSRPGTYSKYRTDTGLVDYTGWLNTAGTETLILSGVETDVCVWATALDAVDAGFFVVLARDALTSGTPEAHQALLDVIAPRFAPQVAVMNHGELEAAWK